MQNEDNDAAWLAPSKEADEVMRKSDRSSNIAFNRRIVSNVPSVSRRRVSDEIDVSSIIIYNCDRVQYDVRYQRTTKGVIVYVHQSIVAFAS